MLFNRKSAGREGPAREPAPEPSGGSARPQAAVEPSLPASRNPAPVQSYIDASLTIVGDLHSEGDVQVDGRICGNVRCAQLIVSRDAVVTGTVTADQAVVRGSITGTIRASVVILQETAQVESDISYTQLVIDDGAAFEGSVHRSDNPLAGPVAASPLAELQRAIAAEGASATAGPSNSHDAGPGRERDTAPPMPDRRNANGRADAQR